MDQEFLDEVTRAIGSEEVARIRAAARKCSHDHAPENIDKCQCRVCKLKRQGISYYQWSASQRGDWIKRELEKRNGCGESRQERS